MNISALNHQRFDNLYQITQNHMKATLLDKCIYFWQNSTYTLDDNQKWFTRSISTLAIAAKISERSVSRYLKEFTEKGLIEKKSVLKMKKHLYIRITSRLLSLLGLNCENNSNFTQLGAIKKDSDALSLYKDNIVNTVNSTVSQNDIVNNSEQLIKNPCTPPTLTTDESESGNKIESTLNEKITERFINYVKGVLKNLQTQHNLQFSNPEKLFAEVIFSVTNTKDQFAGIENLHHRMNIIAKLLREKRWRTPKGFYNHSDIGAQFKEKQHTQKINYQNKKQGQNSLNIALVVPSVNHLKSTSEAYTKQIRNNSCITQIKEINIEIQSQKNYLKQIQCGDKSINSTQPLINSIQLSIQNLHEKRKAVENKISI